MDNLDRRLAALHELTARTDLTGELARTIESISRTAARDEIRKADATIL